MSAAGDLDLERIGRNADAETDYTYTVDGDVETMTKTLVEELNGVEVTKVYTKTFSYSGGNIVSASKWILTTS